MAALVEDDVPLQKVRRATRSMDSLSRINAFTFLFTDVEGSTRLWEQEPERMQLSLARHDALSRIAIEQNRGRIVKTTGDGVFAAFERCLDAVKAGFDLQQSLLELEATGGVAFRVRCGIHCGVVECRDNDFFGPVLNRAARIMSAAHGGQILISQAAANVLYQELPAPMSLLDLGNVRLRDLAKAEHVYQLVHPQLRHDFPALRSLETTPHNLPPELTSFIGRERELDEAIKLLRTTRRLTLLGPGGVGKTRLSLRIADAVLDEYPDGVWFVELAPIADPRRVPQIIATTLGVKEEGAYPILDVLARHVQKLRLLLVLDNCEHLTQACAEVTKRLLHSSSGVRIIASSREPLRIAGEISYTVPPLAAPDPRHTSVVTLTEFAAAHLFIDRAAAAQPAFKLTEQNAPAICNICRRLDGIPLALELAAALVRTLPVETIDDHLSDRFRLLTTGDRTELPRHQTLRGLIDWSHDLLTEGEQILLRRLSAFADGWALEAAEVVCATSESERAGVATALAQLVDKSLVMFSREEARYSLLETVRQYAYERLVVAGEEHAVRTRHLTHYVALVERAGPRLRGPAQGAWLAQLDYERENLLAACGWCDHAEDGATLGLRLVHSAEMYWPNRGLLELGHRLTLEALRRDGADRRTLHRCRALIVAGQQAAFLHDSSRALEYLEESLSIANESEDHERRGVALLLLGRVAHTQADRLAARRFYSESLAIVKRAGNKRAVAGVLESLGQLHEEDGEDQAAIQLYEESLRLSREEGNQLNVALGVTNLARIAIKCGASYRARELLLEAATITVQLDSQWAAQLVLQSCAELSGLIGDWPRSARFLGALEAAFLRTSSNHHTMSEATEQLVKRRARKEMGEEAFATALCAGQTMSLHAAMTEMREWLEAAVSNSPPTS